MWCGYFGKGMWVWTSCSCHIPCCYFSITPVVELLWPGAKFFLTGTCVTMHIILLHYCEFHFSAVFIFQINFPVSGAPILKEWFPRYNCRFIRHHPVVCCCCFFGGWGFMIVKPWLAHYSLEYTLSTHTQRFTFTSHTALMYNQEQSLLWFEFEWDCETSSE